MTEKVRFFSGRLGRRPFVAGLAGVLLALSATWAFAAPLAPENERGQPHLTGKVTAGLAFETPLAWTVPVQASLDYRHPGEGSFFVSYGVFYREAFELPDWPQFSTPYALDVPSTYRQGGLRVLLGHFFDSSSRDTSHSGVQLALVGRWLDYESSITCASLAATCELETADREAYFVRDIGLLVGPVTSLEWGAFVLDVDYLQFFFAPVSKGRVKARLNSDTYAEDFIVTRERTSGADIELRFGSVSLGARF